MFDIADLYHKVDFSSRTFCRILLLDLFELMKKFYLFRLSDKLHSFGITDLSPKKAVHDHCYLRNLINLYLVNVDILILKCFFDFLHLDHV